MKLDSISVDEYRVCRNLQLNELGQGLNLVFGKNGSGKSTVAEFVRNVLYGGPNPENVANGFLTINDNGPRYRLQRTWQSQNQLQVSPIDTHLETKRTLSTVSATQSLSAIDPEIFDAVYLVDGQRTFPAASRLVNILGHKFNVANGDPAEQLRAHQDLITAESGKLRDRMAHLDQQFRNLELEHASLSNQIDAASFDADQKQRLQREIRNCESMIKSADRTSLHEQVQALDSEIADLRVRIDKSRTAMTKVADYSPSPNTLSLLYQRLDEIENQIQRWRQIHADIQQQRILLKDEMVLWNDLTMDSAKHPYHRSREILKQLETQVGLAENTVNHLVSQPSEHQSESKTHTDQLLGCCHQIREGLYQLCDELETQYKTIRHHSAAAELKRLRKCYNAIGENVEALLARRIEMVEEIRLLDPEGANAISRATNEFCQCAHHEGYLAARKRFVGEPEFVAATHVVPVDATSESLRLRELEDLRAARVRELVSVENRLGEWQARRKELINQLNRLSDSNKPELQTRLSQVCRDIDSMMNQKRSLEVELQSLTVRPDDSETPVMKNASQHISQLTNGEIRRIWLASLASAENQTRPDGISGIEIEDRHGQHRSFEILGSGLQQQVVLGICLAIVEHFQRSGVMLPMLLDDVFVNLDPDLIRATYDSLEVFAGYGNQVIAFTADQLVTQIAEQRHATVLDLPETAVTPVVPLWTPDRTPHSPPREPDFLTPFSTRRHEKAPQHPLLYPQVKYPTASSSSLIDHSPENFERPSGHSDYATIHEQSELRLLGSMDLNLVQTLNRRGVYTVQQLLNLDPNQISDQLSEARIAPEELDQWQAQIWLQMCVPALRPEEAQLLVAIGIMEPEQLENTGGQQLVDRISRFLNSADATSQSRWNRDYNRQTINSWYDSLNQTRNRWRLPSGYSRRSYRQERAGRTNESRTLAGNSSRHRSEQREAVAASLRNRSERERRRTHRSSRTRRGDVASNLASRPERAFERNLEYRQTQSGSSSTERKPRKRKSDATAKLKFYLDLSDQLEAAPSIGPKTAERFLAIGVTTVDQFLSQTAESMAPRLNYKRITADVIRQWQHQARLVCRIPNLRGHDAQLLVACGIVEPEDLASRKPEKLFAIIQPFSESKEGLKIIRGGKHPDLAEITDWINWAQQTRSLQAA